MKKPSTKVERFTVGPHPVEQLPADQRREPERERNEELERDEDEELKLGDEAKNREMVGQHRKVERWAIGPRPVQEPRGFERHHEPLVCNGCGGPVMPRSQRAGSVRCPACREGRNVLGTPLTRKTRLMAYEAALAQVRLDAEHALGEMVDETVDPASEGGAWPPKEMWPEQVKARPVEVYLNLLRQRHEQKKALDAVAKVAKEAAQAIEDEQAAAHAERMKRAPTAIVVSRGTRRGSQGGTRTLRRTRVHGVAVPRKPGRKPLTGPTGRSVVERQQRLRAFKALVRPEGVKDRDWGLLKLTMVEDMSVPLAANRMSLRPDVAYKALERLRAKLNL